MSSFIVACLPDERRAAAAVQALEALHREGRITLFGIARIARDAEGLLAALAHPAAPGSAALTQVVEALIAASAIEAGVTPASGRRSPLACLGDLACLGVGTEFVEACLRHITPGVVAVLAEADEHWLAPSDAALAELGGTLIRSPCAGFADDQLAQRIGALEAELQALEQEADGAHGAEQHALHRRANDARARLAAAAAMAQALLARMEEETSARLETMESQLEQAGAELAVRRQVEARITLSVARARREAAHRAATLREAASLALAALGVDEPG